MSSGAERQLLLDLNDERGAFLSAAPAGPRERALAIGVVGLSTLLFAAAVPFAKTPLPPVPAFIASYQAALVVNDVITAVLLFAQFGFAGAWPLLIIATAYVFTALMAVAHMLTFPGLFASTGLLAAGPQSTAWMYMFWHAGFPLAVLAYAFLKQRGADTQVMTAKQAGVAITASTAVALAATVAITLLVTVGQHALPPIMEGNHYTAAMAFVVGSVWGLSALALGALWFRRAHSVLDLWLMVVLCAWVFDIGLAAVFNAGRYDLGFYGGRIYGLLAACFVLVVLLAENGRLYGRLLKSYAGERSERQRAQEKSAELVAANRELDAFSYSVSHDLRTPLRHIAGFARLLEKEHASSLGESARRYLETIRDSVQRMDQLIDDLLAFSRLGRQALAKRRVDVGQLAREVIAGLDVAPGVQVSVGELPVASADVALLKQVLTNLIGNALKYSGKRDVPRVELGARQEGAETVYWVRDNGVGFDMRYAERLFGVFQRLHRAEDFPGTGVGLAIVQRIVARHGGRVWAESSPEAGATFFFSLPLAE